MLKFLYYKFNDMSENFVYNESVSWVVDMKLGLKYNNIIRKACFSSGLTLKSDMLVNYMIDRWRTTLKSDIFTGVQLVVGRHH